MTKNLKTFREQHLCSLLSNDSFKGAIKSEKVHNHQNYHFKFHEILLSQMIKLIIFECTNDITHTIFAKHGHLTRIC